MKRSKRYQEIRKQIEPKIYTLEEALKLIKKTSTVKFDASVEVHIRLGIDPKKAEQQVRGSIVLPHGIGKKIKIAVFSQTNKDKIKEAGADIVGDTDLVAEIKKSKKCDFDIALATSEMMPKLIPIAKILGQKGLMPSPKTETVVQDPVASIKEIKSGKVNFKNDSSGIIHLMIGKISFDDKKIIDNFNALLDAVKKAKSEAVKGEYIKNIVLNATMGPGVRIRV